MHWSETHQAGLLQVATHTPKRLSQALCVCECVSVCVFMCVCEQSALSYQPRICE